MPTEMLSYFFPSLHQSDPKEQSRPRRRAAKLILCFENSRYRAIPTEQQDVCLVSWASTHICPEIRLLLRQLPFLSISLTTAHTWWAKGRLPKRATGPCHHAWPGTNFSQVLANAELFSYQHVTLLCMQHIVLQCSCSNPCCQTLKTNVINRNALFIQWDSHRIT